MTKNVLILGAAGKIAVWVVRMLANREDLQMTLWVRDARKLQQVPRNSRVIEGDVMESQALQAAMDGQHLVYANLAGEVDAQATKIVAAMAAASVTRLVHINGLGIYGEVPGEFGQWNERQVGSYLPTYRRAADIIEASSLDYTIIRPTWLQDKNEVDYATTRLGETFTCTEVSRKSVADLVVSIVTDPTCWSRANIGVHKPGTEGDKPAFM